MRTVLALFVPLICGSSVAQIAQPSPSTMKTPDGTTLPVVIVRQVHRKGLAPNDRVLAQTLASVVSNGHVLIPAGTEFQGEVISVTPPRFLHPQALLTIHFPEAILAGSYVVPLDDELSGGRETVQLTINATKYDDVLLDTGTTFDLPLRTPVNIELARLPASSQAPGLVVAGVPCKPNPATPGTPGTPDTVIPGTPGTPDTVIPGINGGPPTVVPGTPPGQPTVIPGMPAIPGTAGGGCVSAPRVTSVVLVP